MYKKDIDFLRRTAINSVTKISAPVSLYVHIPFCIKKCRYCDFLSAPTSDSDRVGYLKALEQEIKETGELTGRGDAITVDSIFFGGGTPSLLTPGELAALMDTIRASYNVLPDAEVTIECNPGTVDVIKLHEFYVQGVNRISIGVQSFRDEELRLLGRIHTAQQAKQCVIAAREAGFANVNVDLMSALPGQTLAQWMQSLQEAVKLSPEHISAYGLILEEGTELWEMARKSEGRTDSECLPPFPDDETDRRMYHETGRFLKECGYHRYEISNYAREGFECRHNNGYWTGHPYLGFGIGAASYLGNVRWNHTGNLHVYCDGFNAFGSNARIDEKTDARTRKERTEEKSLQDAEKLGTEDQMAEFMFLGLRRMKGVSRRAFAQKFGTSMESVYGAVIKRYLGLGLLKEQDGRVMLTDQGIDISNRIMADFLL